VRLDVLVTGVFRGWEKLERIEDYVKRGKKKDGTAVYVGLGKRAGRLQGEHKSRKIGGV